MATEAPSTYCSFDFTASPGGQFSLCLSQSINGKFAIACYLPTPSELRVVADFLIAAGNGQNPAPIKLTRDADGPRTLTASASPRGVTITIDETNVSTTLSVEFSFLYYTERLFATAAAISAWGK